MKRFAAMAVLVVLAGCETLGLGGSKLPDNLKISQDPGLYARAEAAGEGKMVKVTVTDADGNLQQDARVIVDVGPGGTIPKLTDATGQALIEAECKGVKAIKVEKTEKTRKAGT